MIKSERRLEETMLEGASSIGQKICNQSVWYEDKCNWIGKTVEESYGTRNRKNIVFALGPDIYSGTSGISLFLGYLYHYTKHEIFKKNCIGAITQSISLLNNQYQNSDIRYGFYNGFVGIAYVTAKIGSLLKNKQLLLDGLNILLNLSKEIDNQNINRGNDIIYGNAGSIPALLDLYLNIYGNKKILDLALFLGKELLSKAVKDEIGYSWDPVLVRTGRASHNLTGFAHGAAGIGYSLLELYQQTKVQEYLDGAINAFNYENHWFSKEDQNWPDFRINPGLKIDSTYKRTSKNYIYGRAWCHGAPGIGLTRLRASQLLKTNSYEMDITASINMALKMVNDHPESSSSDNFSLCHGLSGVADLLLYSDEILKTNYRNMLIQFYFDANNEYNSKNGHWKCGIPNGETPDLMLGLSGIGYLFLRLYRPTEVPSILFVTPAKRNSKHVKSGQN
jgi:lantibiotic modifying enzyme